MEKHEEYKRKYHTLYHLEKKIVTKIDEVAMSIFGIKQDSWLFITKSLLYVLFVLNAFACYARPDFLTQMVIVLSLYFLNSESMD
jgi:hypothetical protein